MKGIVIFFNDNNSKYADEFFFDGKSSNDLAENWADNLCLKSYTLNGNDFENGKPNLLALLQKMKEITDSEAADYVIFSYKDLPFLKTDLTRTMIENHTKYLAEYTFADGFPYGFAPEIIDRGCLGILLELVKTTKADFAEKTVSRDCIYELIKSDINSFEVETVLSESDWRLFRYAFHCGKKENYIACKALYKAVYDNNKFVSDYTAEELSEIASKTPGILKTVPGFYNFQISDFCREKKIYSPYCKCYESKFGKTPFETTVNMDFNKFAALVDNIAEYSENAVIGLSAWGEPLSHPEILKFVEKALSYSGLSVFMETDGLSVTDEFCQRLKNIIEAAKERTNGWGKVMVAVSLDAVTDDTYRKIKGTDSSIQIPLAAIEKLEKANPENVYPQFVRINENEEELEAFFRFWNDKNNITGGRFIIEKFNDFSKFLPECKPADLSPLERNVCWHLRRDLTILSNGDVPACYNCMLGGIVGNVFEEGIDAVWKKMDNLLKEHMDENYSERCRNCDEFYTFNF